MNTESRQQPIEHRSSSINASIKRADDCTTMSDVRREIDRLDRRLVELLADRQSYVDAAARIKQDRKTVRDTSRIEDVIQKVVSHARRNGLDPSIAETVWRALVERCIARELKIFDAETETIEAKNRS